ncbi:MAG: site-2 protease family protein [Planctomycetaceae bacterium]
MHWSFGLLVAYVAYSTYSLGGSPAMIAFAIAQLLAVFLCVTLHEYGHSLAARRYGVETVDITLLPIGGVARLKRIPRVPIQELVIAVAGPAVNVVIALLIGGMLSFALGFRSLQLLTLDMMGLAPEGQDLELSPALSIFAMDSWLISFAIFLIAINLWLVLFNSVPAFPMDGGRVLRSILAMKLPYGAATRWAQRIGMGCAAVMAVLAMSADPVRWPMLFIAVFIVYAGRTEAKQVEWADRLGSLSVGDVMSPSAPVVSMDWTIDQLQQWWQNQATFAAAVVGLGEVVVGVVSLKDLSDHLQSHPVSSDADINATAGQLANHDFPRIEASMPLPSVIEVMQRYRQLPVIDEHHRLVGWLDFDAMLGRALAVRSA